MTASGIALDSRISRAVASHLPALLVRAVTFGEVHAALTALFLATCRAVARVRLEGQAVDESVRDRILTFSVPLEACDHIAAQLWRRRELYPAGLREYLTETLQCICWIIDSTRPGPAQGQVGGEAFKLAFTVRNELVAALIESEPDQPQENPAPVPTFGRRPKLTDAERRDLAERRQRAVEDLINRKRTEGLLVTPSTI